jgi:hypothetical protein
MPLSTVLCVFTFIVLTRDPVIELYAAPSLPRWSHPTNDDGAARSAGAVIDRSNQSLQKLMLKFTPTVRGGFVRYPTRALRPRSRSSDR